MTGGQIAEVARDCTLASKLADRLRYARPDLVNGWLQRIAARIAHDPSRLPSAEMIARMPVLLEGIAWYLEHPTDAISTDTPAVARAIELCTLRHGQGFDTRDVLEEYMLLGEVLFDFLKASVEDIRPFSERDVIVCGNRLFHSIMLLEITTTTHFIRLGHEQVAEREGRLRAFNRAVSHEIKNRIGTVINAGELLSAAHMLPREELEHFARIITRNAHEMRLTVENLLVLARLEDDPRELRHARLGDVVADVAKQMQALADAAQIDVQLPDKLPDVEVNTAVTLLLTNYLTNAIKYHDPLVTRRFVRVGVEMKERDRDEPEIIVRVQDNGLGVPVEKRDALFQRFFRAHDRTQAQGTGLGLSIVRETVKALGGSAWADFPEKGSIFCFAVPCRWIGARRSPRPRLDRRSRRGHAERERESRAVKDERS